MIKMSLLMGASLSLCLSLAGNLSSGKFTVPGFLISFAVSFVISIIIGLFVPMKKVNDSLDRKLGLEPGKLGTRCFEALISDLIYTPIITLVMVFIAYKNATSHGGNPPFVPMFLKSLALSMVLGYVLIFFLMPFFLKMLLKRSGIGGPPNGRPPEGRPPME